MYKVIFLDDEPITLRMLESAIDWQKYQVTLGGTASDGEEGIRLFQQVQPDIVIADIRMPKMNGIEFARMLRQARTPVKILLLSAYAEFEYAQSAITYQISDYLLKPLDENKLEAAVARIVQELDHDHTLSSTMEGYRLERAEKQIQQFILRYRENPDAQAAATVPDEIREACTQADTLLHVRRITEPHALHTYTDVEAIRLFFKERLSAQALVVSISPVELIVLAASSDIYGQLTDMVRTLQLRAQPVQVGMSTIPGSFNLIQTYCQAETALSECFYTGEDQCSYSAEQCFSNDIPVSLVNFERPIAELVEQGKSTQLIESLQGCLSDLFAKRVYPSLVCGFVFDVFNWVKLDLAKQYPPNSLAGLGAVDRDRLRACATTDMFVQYLTRHVQIIGEAVQSLLTEDPGYFVVKRAKEYARAHYTEVAFSLQNAADYVGLSKNHFSRVFHRATGMKFWDYVTQLRIEKAKDLLKQSNRSNYEISRAIGYESEYYFSKIFKRVVGVSAQQFRRL